MVYTLPHNISEQYFFVLQTAVKIIPGVIIVLERKKEKETSISPDSRCDEEPVNSKTKNKADEADDEPLESWGWVQNTD